MGPNSITVNYRSDLYLFTMASILSMPVVLWLNSSALLNYLSYNPGSASYSLLNHHSRQGIRDRGFTTSTSKAAALMVIYWQMLHFL